MSEQPTIHTCHDKCKRPMCVMRRERDEARAIAKYWQEQYGHFNPEHEWQPLPWERREAPMTTILAALTDVEALERELAHIHQWVERRHQDGFIDSLSYVANLDRVYEAVHDRLDNALSDAKQADTDSIRALAERNEAREKLAAERALADRLANQLDDCLQSQEDIGWVMQALAAWKEARND